jgi:hypothetical protein
MESREAQLLQTIRSLKEQFQKEKAQIETSYLKRIDVVRVEMTKELEA